MKTIFLTLALAIGVSFSSQAKEEGGKPKTISLISNWMNGNVDYPTSAIENKEEGTVYIAFTIVDGQIVNAEVVKGVSETLDNEVLNTLQTVPVSELPIDTNDNSSYILPVKFDLQ